MVACWLWPLKVAVTDGALALLHGSRGRRESRAALARRNRDAGGTVSNALLLASEPSRR